MVTNPIAKNTLGYRRRVENLYLLPEANSSMSKSAPKTSADLAAALLVHYSFDLSGYSASELINRWQVQYPIDWLHLAVIEALYQGRYKGISVQQILAFWLRRGQATYHFNMEFERLICSKFPESLTALAAPVLPPAKKDIMFETVSNSQSSPALDDASPAAVDNECEYQTASLQSRHEEEGKRVESILASSTLSHIPAAKKLSSKEINFLLQNSPPETKSLPSGFSSDAQELANAALTAQSKATALVKQSEKEGFQATSYLTGKRSAYNGGKPADGVAPPEEPPKGFADLKQGASKPALPPAANHPPIEQFTPETSDRSESFTSKLKAISNENQ